MQTEELLERWRTDEDLVADLCAVAGQTNIGEVNVAVCSEGTVRGASVSFLGQRIERHAFETATVCLGCLTKPFVATLVAQAAIDGDLDLDADAEAQFWEFPPDADGVLAGITVRHLLNHTHGLDGSAFNDAPRTAAGFIDLAGLLNLVQGASRLALPGELYSYNNLGAWLAASLLEIRFQAPFEQLLIERLLGPLQIEAESQANCVVHSRAAHGCCPALGGRMALRLPDLLRFLEFSSHMKEVLDRPVALPGWAFERGVCLGWKTYGRGWYGHNSDAPGCSALVRFSPHRRLAMVTAALSRGASLIEGRLFGRIFPELHSVLPWRQSRPVRAGAIDISPYPGTYTNNSRRLTVCARADGVLTLKSEQGGGSECGVLRLVCESTFLSGLPGRSHFGWLQFIRPSRDGSFSYLWNGMEIFRRIGCAGSAVAAGR